MKKLFKTNIIFIRIIKIIIVINFIFLSNRQVSAQTARSFTISPPSIKFQLNPGEKAEKSFKITNNTDEPLTFYANVQDFVVTDKDGTPELLPADLRINNRFAASAWATVIPDQLTIAPRKSAFTTLYLQVPGDARPGGRYVAVAFKSASEEASEGTSALVNTVAGSLIYLTVNGEIAESGRITSFSAPLFSEHGPVDFTLEIKNTGDVHINPKGKIDVQDCFGRKAFSTAIESHINIFPDTSRTFTGRWEKKWPAGRFRADFSGYFGQNNNLPLAATLTFWVIPCKPIALVAAAVILAIVIVKKTSSARKKIPEETEKER